MYIYTEREQLLTPQENTAKCAAHTLTNVRRSRDKNSFASTAVAYYKGREGEGEGERGGEEEGEGERGGGGGGESGCRDQKNIHIQNTNHTQNTKLTQNTKYIYVPRISEALSFAVFMATSGNFRLHLVAAAEERLVARSLLRALVGLFACAAGLFPCSFRLRLVAAAEERTATGLVIRIVA
jgi:hypothetical protein